MEVAWIEDEQEFAELEAPWEALADEHAGMPFVRHAWLSAWWRAYGGGRRLAVCVARDGERLLAAFPLLRHRGALEALANEHSPSFRPFAVDEATLRLVVDAVVGSGAGLLRLPLAADDPALPLPLLEAASRRAGRSFWVERTVTSPYIELRGTFADYRTLVGRNARKESERRTRRLEEAGGVIRAIVKAEDVEAELEAGLRLEASGWKGRRGTAVLASPADAAFYRDLAHRLHARDVLRFSWVHVDGTPVAFTFNLVDFGRVWSLKFGMSEDFRNFAPGIVATYADVREAYEQGFDAYELLGDFEPWKERFAKVSRDQVLVHSYRRSPYPLARVGYRRLLRPRLKKAYNSLRKR